MVSDSGFRAGPVRGLEQHVDRPVELLLRGLEVALLELGLAGLEGSLGARNQGKNRVFGGNGRAWTGPDSGIGVTTRAGGAGDTFAALDFIAGPQAVTKGSSATTKRRCQRHPSIRALRDKG